MFESLTDKVIIVTGAGSGIGRACAAALVDAGARTVLVDLNEAGMAETLADAGSPDAGRARAMRLSVTDEADMGAMADATLSAFGQIDGLVACAGILRAGESLKTIADTSMSEWRAVLDTNLTGTFLSNRAVLGPMIGQRSGDIVNVSSTSGRQGRPFDGPYSASKFGIIGLSESLSEEVSRQGIRVQTVLPDAVATPLWDQNGPGAMKPVAALPPKRVAEFILYLLALPRDTMLINPVIAPFKSRKTRGKS